MVRVRAQVCMLAGICVLFQTRHVAAKSRFSVTLDDGSTVTVDNASSYSNSLVGNQVLAADRSTQEDCPYNPPNYKGLFKNGDRIFCSDNYLAWFDYSQNDGVTFANPPYGGSVWRSGVLAGWWSLSPPSGNFRYFRTGPNGCNNWAHNELIPGSASPNRDQHWWDRNYTPSEFVLVPVNGANWYFLSYAFARHTANSNWTNVLDGTEDAAGVHYKTSARMTSWTYNVDVVDGNDGNGISNYIQADVEYICAPDGISAIWNFKPNGADVTLNNAFIFFWTAYAQEEDGTSCDAGGTGSQWPGIVYGQPLYNQSSLAVKSAVAPFGPFASGTIVQTILGDTCSDPYFNTGVYSSPPFSVGDGSWFRVGESSTLSINSPRFQFNNKGVPNSGTGTAADPIRFAWEILEAWNETHDGTLGFGAGRGPYTDPADYIHLLAGKWYRAEFSLSVVNQIAAKIGLSSTSFDRTVSRGKNPPNDNFTVTNVDQGVLNYSIGENAAWFSVTPGAGSSIGEADTINIMYTTSALALGNYAATITVSDPDASNSPQTIAVTMRVTTPGDFNLDGDVDQDDFGHLEACFGNPPPAGCGDADLNGDSIVDNADWVMFLPCLGGADRGPGC